MIDYSKEYRENIKDSKKFNLDYTKSELDRLFEDVRNCRSCSYYKDINTPRTASCTKEIASLRKKLTILRRNPLLNSRIYLMAQI